MQCRLTSILDQSPALDSWLLELQAITKHLWPIIRFLKTQFQILFLYLWFFYSIMIIKAYISLCMKHYSKYFLYVCVCVILKKLSVIILLACFRDKIWRQGLSDFPKLTYLKSYWNWNQQSLVMLPILSITYSMWLFTIKNELIYSNLSNLTIYCLSCMTV